MKDAIGRYHRSVTFRGLLLGLVIGRSSFPLTLLTTWQLLIGLILRFGLLNNRPSHRTSRELLGQGGSDLAVAITQAALRLSEHNNRALHQRLTRQAPFIGPALELGLLDTGSWGQRIRSITPRDLNKASDALTTSIAVTKTPLEPIELHTFPQGHITEIFARITLHITPFTDESDHGHGQHQLKQDTIVSPGISFCNRNEAEARLTPGAMSKGQHRLR